jgi:hypothetical protein
MYTEKREAGILNFAAPCSIITVLSSEQNCFMSLSKTSYGKCVSLLKLFKQNSLKTCGRMDILLQVLVT